MTAAGAAVGIGAPVALSQQDVLSPIGPQAGSIGDLFWFNTAIHAAVFGIVMAFVVGALVKARRARPAPNLAGLGAVEAAGFGGGVAIDGPDVHPDPGRERRAGVIASVAIGFTVLILLILIGFDYGVGRSLKAMEQIPDQVDITVTGHQWWWDVQYTEGDVDKHARTANEIHIPVGRPVRLKLQSSDVIHSFWAPNLHGKKDLIPGHPTHLSLRADTAGTYTGQCAEFCGHQHAHMRFTVRAEQPEQFEAWLAAQRAPAAEPATDSQRRGREVFLSGTCAMCHTVMGTPAGSRVGPDLTHVASRPTIAGGSMPNTRGNLAAWVLDPQHVKPGVRMPSQTLPAPDVHALLDYLESLK